MAVQPFRRVDDEPYVSEVDADEVLDDRLDTEFGRRIAQFLADAQAATGTDARINSQFRERQEQAQAYTNYLYRPWTDPVTGITYTPEHKTSLAAYPGNSRHELGQAMDVARGPVLNWMRTPGRAAQYGLEFLPGNAGKIDPVHVQLARGSQAPKVPPPLPNLRMNAGLETPTMTRQAYGFGSAPLRGESIAPTTPMPRLRPSGPIPPGDIPPTPGMPLPRLRPEPPAQPMPRLRPSGEEQVAAVPTNFSPPLNVPSTDEAFRSGDDYFTFRSGGNEMIPKGPYGAEALAQALLSGRTANITAATEAIKAEAFRQHGLGAVLMQDQIQAEITRYLTETLPQEAPGAVRKLQDMTAKDPQYDAILRGLLDDPSLINQALGNLPPMTDQVMAKPNLRPGMSQQVASTGGLDVPGVTGEMLPADLGYGVTTGPIPPEPPPAADWGAAMHALSSFLPGLPGIPPGTQVSPEPARDFAPIRPPMIDGSTDERAYRDAFDSLFGANLSSGDDGELGDLDVPSITGEQLPPRNTNPFQFDQTEELWQPAVERPFYIDDYTPPQQQTRQFSDYLTEDFFGYDPTPVTWKPTPQPAPSRTSQILSTYPVVDDMKYGVANLPALPADYLAVANLPALPADYLAVANLPALPADYLARTTGPMPPDDYLARTTGPMPPPSPPPAPILPAGLTDLGDGNILIDPTKYGYEETANAFGYDRPSDEEIMENPSPIWYDETQWLPDLGYAAYYRRGGRMRRRY